MLTYLRMQVEIYEQQVLGKGAVGKVCKGKYRVSVRAQQVQEDCVTAAHVCQALQCFSI